MAAQIWAPDIVPKTPRISLHFWPTLQATLTSVQCIRCFVKVFDLLQLASQKLLLLSLFRGLSHPALSPPTSKHLLVHIRCHHSRSHFNRQRLWMVILNHPHFLKLRHIKTLPPGNNSVVGLCRQSRPHVFIRPTNLLRFLKILNVSCLLNEISYGDQPLGIRLLTKLAAFTIVWSQAFVFLTHMPLIICILRDFRVLLSLWGCLFPLPSPV